MDLARAREFGGRFGARLFFDDLTELDSCGEVDAVYQEVDEALNAVPQIVQEELDH